MKNAAQLWSGIFVFFALTNVRTATLIWTDTATFGNRFYRMRLSP